MLTLQNKLYESLLDDEEELISKSDDNIIQDLISDTFGDDSKYIQVKDGKISCFMELQDSTQPHFKSHIIRGGILRNIFSGEFLTDYEYFKWISISTPDFFKNLPKKQINISEINYLYINTVAMNFINSKNLNIKKVNESIIDLNISNITNWMPAFKNTKFGKLNITNTSPKVEEIAKQDGLNINGLNVDTLILHPSLVPGFDSTMYDTDWDKVKAYITAIKNSNKIKNVYVIDAVSKTRFRIGDRFVHINKLNNI